MTQTPASGLGDYLVDDSNPLHFAQSTTKSPASVSVEPAPPSASPEGDGEGPGSLSRRFLRPETLVSFGIALAILIFFFRRLHIDFRAVWLNIKNANLFLYGLAFIAFYSGFILRALRWRKMLARVGLDEDHGYPIPSTGGLVEIFLLSWFANCIVPAKLGDAYRSYLLKKEAGTSFSSGLGTIVAERLIDLVVLFITMSVMGAIVFRTHMPAKAEQAFVLGLGLLVLAAGVLAVMWLARHRLEHRMPAKVRDQYNRLHDAIFACLRQPGSFLLTSVGIWTLEGVRLFLVALALGADVSFATATVVALMSSLLTTLPITPAGLGVVEVAMVTVFKWTGLDASMAGSLALLDRVIGYWSIIAVGLVLYIRRFRKEVG